MYRFCLDAGSDAGQDADVANPMIDLGQDASIPECTTKIYYGAYGEGFFEAPGINTGTYCATPCIGPASCVDDNDCFVEQCSKPRCIRGRCVDGASPYRAVQRLLLHRYIFHPITDTDPPCVVRPADDVYSR